MAIQVRMRIDSPHIEPGQRGALGPPSAGRREPFLLVDGFGPIASFRPILGLLRALGLPAFLARLGIGIETPSGAAVLLGVMGGLMLLLSGPVIVLRHWIYRRARSAAWGDWTWLLAGLAGWAATLTTTATRTETAHNRLLVFVIASLVAATNLTLVGALADSLGWVERRPRRFWTERLGTTIAWTAAVLWMLLVAVGALTA